MSVRRRKRRIPIIAVRWLWLISILCINLSRLGSAHSSFQTTTSWLIVFRITLQMTADALTDNIDECAKHGMDNFIAKPVNLEKLEELLIKHVPSLDYDST
jgi:hypothetical protein